MKKLLIAAGVIVFVLVAAVIIVPFVVPVETYKAEIQAQVRDATGRDLEIGEVGLSIFPAVALRARDVRFSNAEGATDASMAEIGQLELSLQVLPLLSGEIAVDRFVLVDPVISLEVDEEGRPNWVLAAGQSEASESSEPTGETSEETQTASRLQGLRLGDVRLVNGTVVYRDRAAGQTQKIENLNVKLSLPSLDAPFAAEGSARWNGETVDLKVKADSLQTLMAGSATQLAATLDARPLRLSFAGSVQQAPVLQMTGEIDVDAPSVRGLATWAGQPIELAGDGLERFHLNGQLDLEDKTVALNQVSILLDAIEGKGEFLVDAGGAKPLIKARLDLQGLDLNPYMAPSDATEGESGTAPAADQPPGDWSDDPIDLSGLGALDADLVVATTGIKVQKIEIGRSSLSVVLQDGVMTATLQEMELYDGNGQGEIKVDGAKATPTLAASFDLSDVQAEPLLTDASGFDKLLGRMSGKLSVTTAGGSQRQMISNLDGSGAVTFLDGAIRGFNLAALLRNLSVTAIQKGFDDAQKTDFAELSGTFQIADGIVRNDDMKLLAPLLRADGSGTIPLPSRTIDYVMRTRLVASIEGQGTKSGAKGVTVPVRLHGPWHDIAYSPDLKGVLEDALTQPDQLIEGVESLTKDGEASGEGVLKGVLEGLTGKSKSSTQEPSGTETQEQDTQQESKPKNLLKGLFGNSD